MQVQFRAGVLAAVQVAPESVDLKIGLKLAAATTLDPSAEEAMETHVLLGADVCAQIAPESNEQKMPVTPLRAFPGHSGDAAAKTLAPSAEHATDAHQLLGAPLGNQVAPESADI
jgi:hypothetical protein